MYYIILMKIMHLEFINFNKILFKPNLTAHLHAPFVSWTGGDQ